MGLGENKINIGGAQRERFFFFFFQEKWDFTNRIWEKEIVLRKDLLSSFMSLINSDRT